MSAKNGILLAIIVVAGALALWFFATSEGRDVHPDTEETATHWMCEDCGFMAKLTSKQRDEWSDTDRVRQNEPGDKQTVYRCEKCGTYTMVRAIKCPAHKIWYVATRSDGSPGGCPMCQEEDERGGPIEP